MRADGRTRERKELRQKDEKKQRKDKSRVGRCLPFFRQQLAQRAACGCCYWGSVVEGVWCSCGSRGEGERGNERERERVEAAASQSLHLCLSLHLSLSLCVCLRHMNTSLALCVALLCLSSPLAQISRLFKERGGFSFSSVFALIASLSLSLAYALSFSLPLASQRLAMSPTYAHGQSLIAIEGAVGHCCVHRGNWPAHLRPPGFPATERQVSPMPTSFTAVSRCQGDAIRGSLAN